MTDLLSRLNAEIYRVAHEARKADARRNTFAGIDIYAHPEAIMHFRRELEPFVQFQMDDPKKMPPNAIGKYMDCWVFSDVAQPQGALIIRLDGNVYSDVPISTDLPRPNQGSDNAS